MKKSLALTTIIAATIAACAPETNPTGIKSPTWGVSFESNVAEYRLKQALCYEAGIKLEDCEQEWLSALPTYRSKVIDLAHPTNGYISNDQAEKTLAVARAEASLK